MFKNGKAVYVIYFLFLLFMSNIAKSQSGSLVKDFGDNGFKTIIASEKNDFASTNVSRILKVRNNKIMVIGKNSNYSNQDFFVARFHNNGSIDTSFNHTGKVTFAAGIQSEVADAIAEDNNGRIVVGVNSCFGCGVHYGILFRFNENGALDMSFGNQGKADLPSENSNLASLLTTGNNEIIVGVNNNNSYSTLKFKAEGIQDLTYGDNGVFKIPISFATTADMKFDGKKRIVISGTSTFPVGLAVARLQPDGKIDSTFGNFGVYTLREDNTYSSTFSIDKKNRIYLAGSTTLNYNPVNIMVVRLTENGSLDLSYNEDGKVYLPITSKYFLKAAVLTKNGNLIIGCMNLMNSANAIYKNYILNLDSTGRTNVFFGSKGWVYAPVGKDNEELHSMIVDDSDTITIGGHYSVTHQAKGFMARLTSGGLYTHNFGINGVSTFSIGYSSEKITCMKIDQNKRILLAGGLQSNENSEFYVTRLHEDGAYDLSFNKKGWLSFPVYQARYYDMVTSMDLNDNNKIVLAGNYFDGRLIQGKVIRLNNDGSFDSTFNGEGQLNIVADSGGLSINKVQCVPGNKIFIWGNFQSYDFQRNFSVLYKLNQDGSFDTSFDGDGKKIIQENGKNIIIHSFKTDALNRIILGWSGGNDWTNQSHRINRLLPDGTPDNTFGTNGMKQFVLTPSTLMPQRIEDIATDPSNNIYTAITANMITINSYFGIAKIKENGDLDNLFDEDGMDTIAVKRAATGSRPNQNHFDIVKNIHLMSNGKTIMTGHYSYYSDYMAVCILPDGTLDKTFGDSGNGVYVRSQDEQVSCSAISDDKFLYLAGTTDGHILLAKIHLEPTVTGIENVEKIKNNYVHPVPTKGDFTFNSLENSNVDVYNSMGIKVASFAVTKGENNISLSLEPGWYVLRGDLGSHKIIIE